MKILKVSKERACLRKKILTFRFVLSINLSRFRDKLISLRIAGYRAIELLLYVFAYSRMPSRAENVETSASICAMRIKSYYKE